MKNFKKIDSLYEKDHVTAFKFVNGNDYDFFSTKNNRMSNNNSSIRSESQNPQKIPNPSNLKPIKPIPSKCFRVEEILRSLKSHFRDNWELD